MVRREQLEHVIAKRKVGEVHQWFHEHFVNCPREAYINKCPFLIIQGPTGCGKTSTLKCIAKELKITIQEYSETTDTTAINYDVANTFNDDANDERNHTIDKRRAAKFERFVIEHLRFATLYPVDDEPGPASADSEFESDDDFLGALPSQAPPQPKASGVIIHIETPLAFSRSQRVLTQTLIRLTKIIKGLCRTSLRRVAIVFENLEEEKEVLSLPTKLKNSLGIHTIKFNPITRANMKKFIEILLRNHPNIVVDRDAIELLVGDSDGDLRSCANTFELLCNRTNAANSISSHDLNALQLNEQSQVFKRQRLNPLRLKFHPNLLRDVTRSSGFFHLLGKIFYQKRLYPERYVAHRKLPRSIDRPYRTENSTEYILTRLDVGSKNLIAWLHQHYIQFCGSSNLSKAALFLEHLSDVDTISIDATQSSQYYEMHNTLDQMQSHLAIDATVFSLYEDQSRVTKPSHKKITTAQGPFVLKPSVEIPHGSNGDLYSFGRPASMSVQKLISDYQLILSHLAGQMQPDVRCTDPSKILVDHVPYINYIVKGQSSRRNSQQLNGHSDARPSFMTNHDLRNIISILDVQEHNNSKVDFEEQHENLLDIIQDIERSSEAQLSSLFED